MQGSLDVWNATSFASIAVQRRQASTLASAEDEITTLKDRVHHVAAQAETAKAELAAVTEQFGQEQKRAARTGDDIARLLQVCVS